RGALRCPRSGSIDPGLLVYLMERQGLTASELDSALNQRSGLLGVSGVSPDLPPVLEAAEAGDVRAQLARDLFVYRIQAAIGAMAAALDGLDALVFTGGIGQNSAAIRTLVASRLGHLGVRLERSANEQATSGTELEISAGHGRTGICAGCARGPGHPGRGAPGAWPERAAPLALSSLLALEPVERV